jgi:hypothetical protein
MQEINNSELISKFLSARSDIDFSLYVHDFENSLDDVSYLERCLDNDELVEYIRNLEDISGSSTSKLGHKVSLVLAPAKLRFAALLKTIKGIQFLNT